MAETYLRLSTVAERLDCSARTVRRLIYSGDLAAVRVNARTLRVAESELDRFLAERATTPAGGRS